MDILHRPMTEADRHQLERDLEECMAVLKATNDPERRRDLLRKMRQLVGEADRLIVEPSE
jgi:hypothetical protein